MLLVLCLALYFEMFVLHLLIVLSQLVQLLLLLCFELHKFLKPGFLVIKLFVKKIYFMCHFLFLVRGILSGLMKFYSDLLKFQRLCLGI